MTIFTALLKVIKGCKNTIKTEYVLMQRETRQKETHVWLNLNDY